MAVPNLKSLVAKIRKQYPETMTREQVGEALYRIAVEAQAEGHDIGLLLKKGGHRVPSPIGEISSDILVDIPDEQEYDVFINADGEPGKPQAVPAWNKLKSKVGGPFSGAKMKDVRRPIGAVPQPPPPAPQPEPEPPAPVPVPDPVPGLGDLIELLTKMDLRAEERHEAVIVRLDRLANAMRKSRPFEGSARFIGTMRGTVEGVEV